MKVKISVLCRATYTSELEIPDDVEDLETYANNHLSETNVDELEWLEDIEGSAIIL